MGEAARRIATYADIEALPPHLVGEIIDGELFTMSRPAPRHARAQIGLASWSFSNFDNRGGSSDGWWILAEPELHLRADVLVPDIAGWRKSTLPELPETAYFSVAPAWICEVLSPSTQAFDRERKMNIYAREGVVHAWLVDPAARLLEVYELEATKWYRRAVHVDVQHVRVPPFEEVELDLSLLWV